MTSVTFQNSDEIGVTHVQSFNSGFTVRACSALFLAAVCAGSATAQQVKSGDLVLDNAWSRATPGGAKVGGGYLTVDNKGSTADKLMGGSSPAAGKVEVHEMAMNNGVMTMRPLKDGLPIPAGQIGHIGAGRLPLHVDGAESPTQKR